MYISIVYAINDKLCLIVNYYAYLLTIIHFIQVVTVAKSVVNTSNTKI